MLILFIIIFLILSGFFSGSEMAFVSANKLGIEVKKERGLQRGKIIAGFYEKPKYFLGTMLIGNNIALVIFTYLMTVLLYPLFESWLPEGPLFLFLNTIIITIVVLIFGEFLPKTLFRLYPNKALFLFAYPLVFFKAVLKPFTWFINKFSNLILKYLLGTSIEKVDTVLTRMDLENFLVDNINEEHEKIDKEIFSNVLKLNQLKVRDCMIPRNEIVHVDVNDKIKKLLKKFKDSRHSRLFVTDSDLENVMGYIHHAQLIDNPKSIKKLILEVPFVPGAMNVRDLMLRFINKGTNIACVVNEFGGTAGLITLEDILEEIFGEIEDEYDIEEHIEEKKHEGVYLFSGRLELGYIEERYPGLKFPAGEFNTLSGYIIMTIGRIPKEGSIIELGGYRYIIESVSDTKIELLRVIDLRKTKASNNGS